MNYGQILLAKFLDKLESRGEILPGSRERIFQHVPPSPDPGRLFQSAVDLLAGNREEKRNPVFLTLAGKKALRQSEPLQFLLERLPLKEGSSALLFREWAAYLCDKPLANQAQIVVDRLSRTHEEHLADNPNQPYLNRLELRAIAALEPFRYMLDPQKIDAEELAKKWSQDLGRLPHHEALKRVYSRLREPTFAGQFCLGGHPIAFIPGGDKIFQPLSPDEDRAIPDKVLARRAAIAADGRAQLATMRRELEKVEAENREAAARIREYEASRS